MKRTDQQICIDAIRGADVLDNKTIDAALLRIDRRNHFGVETVERMFARTSFTRPPRCLEVCSGSVRERSETALSNPCGR
jgi:hypothetical protein